MKISHINKLACIIYSISTHIKGANLFNTMVENWYSRMKSHPTNSSDSLCVLSRGLAFSHHVAIRTHISPGGCSKPQAVLSTRSEKQSRTSVYTQLRGWDSGTISLEIQEFMFLKGSLRGQEWELNTANKKWKKKKRTVNTTPISKPEKVAGGGSRCENLSFEKQKGS